VCFKAKGFIWNNTKKVLRLFSLVLYQVCNFSLLLSSPSPGYFSLLSGDFNNKVQFVEDSLKGQSQTSSVLELFTPTDYTLSSTV
jgi:hypothetical protein